MASQDSFLTEAISPNAGGNDQAGLCCAAAADDEMSQCCAIKHSSESSDTQRGAFDCNASGSNVAYVSPEERAWRRLLDERHADGYRDGMAAATAPGSDQLQKSFNSGFAQCFSFFVRLAKLRGLLAAVVMPLKTTSDERSKAFISAAAGTAAWDYSSADLGDGQCSGNRLSCVMEKIARLEDTARDFAAKTAGDAWHVEERYVHELDELASTVDGLLCELGLSVNAAC